MNSSNIVTAHNNARSRHVTAQASVLLTTAPRPPTQTSVGGHGGRASPRYHGMAFSPEHSTFHIASALILSTAMGSGPGECGDFHFPDGVRRLKTSRPGLEPCPLTKFRATSTPPSPLLQMMTLIEPGLPLGRIL